MAESLVESLTAETFEAEKFTDTYRGRVMELIEAKAAGETLVATPAVDTTARVVDLMAALEASVKAAKERRGDAAPTATTAKGAKSPRAATKAATPTAKAPAAKVRAPAARKTAARAAKAAPVEDEDEAKQVRSRRRKSA